MNENTLTFIIHVDFPYEARAGEDVAIAQHFNAKRTIIYKHVGEALRAAGWAELNGNAWRCERDCPAEWAQAEQECDAALESIAAVAWNARLLHQYRPLKEWGWFPVTYVDMIDNAILWARQDQTIYKEPLYQEGNVALQPFSIHPHHSYSL